MTLRFEVTRDVLAPPGRVWDVLGDFGAEHRWTRTLSFCERDTPEPRVGTSRTCTLPRPLMGRTRVRETLIEYEPGRSLAYVLDGAAGPFAKAASRWTIAPSPGGTRVRVEGSFEPRRGGSLLWPLARPYVARVARGVLDELDAHLRAGPPSDGAPRGQA